MGLLQGLKESIVELLQPGTRQTLGEARALREMYDARNTNMLPNTLYRVHNHERGNFAGFSFVCNCGVEYQLLNITDWTREYECKACGAKFCAYRMLGIIDADGNYLMKQSEIEARIAKLPMRPRLSGRPAPSPFIEIGNDEASVEWDGPRPSVPAGW